MKNKPVRCSKCNKLLFVISNDLKGKIEVKCPRCRHKNEISK